MMRPLVQQEDHLGREPASEGRLIVGVSDIVLRMAMRKGRFCEAMFQAAAGDSHEARASSSWILALDGRKAGDWAERRSATG